MGLFDRPARQDQRDQQLDDASRAIASIFSPQSVPHNVAATSTTRTPGASEVSRHQDVGLSSATVSLTDADHSTAARQTGTHREWWRVWSSSSSSTSTSTAQHEARQTSALSACDVPPSVFRSASSSPSSSSSVITTSWEDLPACPISGYELTRKGLIDRLAQPQAHLLDAGELRALLVELAGVEQRAKYTVDTQFASTVGSRGHHGLELFVNPCLFLTGIYLTTWKTAKLYREAVPRQSILLTKCLALLRWSMPAAEQERVAQQHRRLMQATNARVSLSFLTGLFVLGVAIWTRPTMDVMETAPEVEQAKQAVAYQQHSERSLKWLWFVYYHHPSYAKEAKSLLAPVAVGPGIAA